MAQTEKCYWEWIVLFYIPQVYIIDLYGQMYKYSDVCEQHHHIILPWNKASRPNLSNC